MNIYVITQVAKDKRVNITKTVEIFSIIGLNVLI